MLNTRPGCWECSTNLTHHLTPLPPVQKSCVPSSKMQVVVAFALACLCVVAVVAHPQPLQRQVRSPDDNKDGGWAVKTDQTIGGGTVVRGEAQKKWDVTQDGKVQAEVHGHWERTYGGPQNGQRDHGYGGSIGGSWGK